MGSLRWTEIMFTVAGCHLRPCSYSPVKKWLYKIHSIVGKLILHSLFMLEMLDIFFNIENQDEFADNFALTSMEFILLVKFKMLAARRDNILILIDRVDKSIFLPANVQEMEIRSRYEKIINLTAKVYTGLLAFFISAMFCVSLAIDFKGRKLISRIWLPYDYTSLPLYLLSSAYEFTASIYAVGISAACESLYSGMVFHICYQFELLEHRIKILDGKNCYAMKRLAEMVNNEFTGLVSFQFFVSMAVICLNLYRIKYAQNLVMFMESLMFSVCVFSQIFYYCFYGNTVKAKSIDFPDKIFGSNWPSWNNSSKKILLMVIRRSRVPIEFTGMRIITLNLESFMSMLKTSYSAFNLMQTSR